MGKRVRAPTGLTKTNTEEETMKCVNLAAIGIGILLACATSHTSYADKGADDKKVVVVKGSDTMVNLVSAWSEEYTKANPGSDVSVTGGGSGVGIAALINKTTDICAASREIKAEEKKKAADNKVEAHETIVARDGIAIVVNPSNPLKEISQDQLRQIFTGEATSWKQFGGADEKIIVLSRESSSGTYVFFQEHVLDKKDYAAGARLLPTTSAIIEGVATDKTAIGYVGLGYAQGAKDRVKVLPVKKDTAAAAVTPTEDAVRSGRYPIARPLFFYTNGTPSGSIQKFVEFCLGPKGQKIVTDEGYVTLK
jgi:phosphate transport system substrate-binding protein